MRTRPIPDKPNTYFQTTHLQNRPIRIAYIVNRNLDQELLRSVLTYNSSVWGGRYNLFVPSNGKTIREDWWRILLIHDPDIVLFINGIGDTLVHKIREQIQPFHHMVWSNEFIETLDSDYDRFGIPASVLFQHYYETKGVLEADKTNCVYPMIAEGSFANYFYIAHGNYAVARYADQYKQLLAAPEFLCSPQNLSEYFGLCNELQRKMTLMKFSSLNLSTIYNNPNRMYGATVILDAGTIDSLFLFHIMSWSPNLSRTPTVIIPFSLLDSDDDYSALSTWLDDNVKGATFITLLNSDEDLDFLRTVRNRLKPLLPNRFKNVDLIGCNFITDFPTMFDKVTQQQVRREGNKFTFTVPDLELANSTRIDSGYIIEANLAPELSNNNGFIPSRFSGLNLLLSEYSLETLRNLQFPVNANVRISRDMLALRAFKSRIRPVRLPETTELFTLLFENKDWKVRKDEKGRYYQGMLKLVGGLEEMSILRNEICREFFADRGFRSGVAYSIDEMMKRFKLGKRIIDLKEIVLDLSLKSVLLRGYYLRCSHCDLTRWYSINDGDEKMRCQGCLSEFQIYPDVDFAFRLNELFIQGLKQGGRTVLLTLLVLKASVQKSLIWDVGYKLTNLEENEVDIDFVAMCDGHLIMGECKDSLPQDISQLLTQLENDFKTAVDAGASFFVLSTLDSDIPQEVNTLIEKHEKAFPQMLIYIFNTDELMGGKLVDSENKERQVFVRDLVKPLSFYEGNCSDRGTNKDVDARMMTF